MSLISAGSISLDSTFKGPGSFKRSLKNCRNLEDYKAYRTIPPMTHLLNGWTIPLNVEAITGT